MKKNTLVRGTSKESETAKNLLEEANIEFREVFSGTTYHSPVLIISSNAYAYKGLSSIREYCKYIAEFKK